MKHLIYKLKGHKLLQAAAVVLLLTSACSNKKLNSKVFNSSTTASDSWYAAGILPTGSQLNLSSSPFNISANSSIGSSAPQSAPVQSESFVTQQTAQDFGDLNWCYQNILNRGNQLFGTGTPAEQIFEGAGNALVKCYNDVLTERARRLEEARVLAEDENNRQQFFTKLLQFIPRNSPQFEIGLPPSRFK